MIISDRIVWIFIAAILAALYYLLRDNRALHRKLLLRDAAEPADGADVAAAARMRKHIFLFLNITDSDNKGHIQDTASRYPSHRLIVVFRGPDWKSNLLRRALPPEAVLWRDENGMMTDLFRVQRFPTVIAVDEAFHAARLQPQLKKPN